MADNENKEVRAADTAKKEVAKKPKKDKVPFMDRVKKFFRDYKSEMKKIVWCSWENVVKLTGVVLACIVVVSVFLGVIDFSFSKLLLLLGGLY